jgi:2-amino-4-hydroxy-6-hydroxymethyldihydropteridine diphosphokinase
MRHVTYIALGSNVGDKLPQCRKAISEILNIDRNRLLAQSSFYKTQPLSCTAQDWFVNGVIKLETELEAQELLRSLKALESRLGRRETFRWGPRTIDLDILFFDDEQIRSEELVVPHPLLHERQFVLVPLAEIDPHLLHPVLKRTVQELLTQLKEDQGVEKLHALDLF